MGGWIWPCSKYYYKELFAWWNGNNNAKGIGLQHSCWLHVKITCFVFGCAPWHVVRFIYTIPTRDLEEWSKELGKAKAMVYVVGNLMRQKDIKMHVRGERVSSSTTNLGFLYVFDLVNWQKTTVILYIYQGNEEGKWDVCSVSCIIQFIVTHLSGSAEPQ